MDTTMGQRLRARREELGIKTVAELARMAGGVSRSALSQLENGITRELSYRNTIAVAKVLGLNPDWLASGHPPKLASKAKDPQWTANLTDAQRELVEMVRMYGCFLPDAQCRAIAEIIRGSRPLEEQAE